MFSKKSKNKETDAQIKEAKEDRLMRSVEVWTSFYRANPHRFVLDYIGIQLKVFQQIIICMMFKFTNSIYLASRGGGKSFLLAVFCCAYCILYPGTMVCIASGTRGQAREIIDKIQKMLPNSPNLANEIADLKTGQTDCYINFKNGSTITVVTASDTARHNRATILIVDEYRLVDKYTIDTVLTKFLTCQRTPGFYSKPEYKDHPKEKSKELYASSCWYEDHWSYEHLRSYAVNMVRGRSYFCCSMPYQLAIKEDLLDRDRVENEMSESNFNAIVFQMEMEGLFFGQGKSGFYNFEELNKSRKLQHAYYPREDKYRFLDKSFMIPVKNPGEKRILSADLALMSSNKNKNDATSIFVNFMVPTSGGRYIKNIVYTENNEGLRTDTQALVIRRLFAEFDCDYLVIDAKGLGLAVIDALMGELYDQESGITYPPLSCCNNEEIANRCIDSNAPKVIWAVQGSVDFNSQCALGLREELKQNLIRLLISEYDVPEMFSKIKGFNSLSPGEQLDLKMPYLNTTLLINELINLEYESRNNAIRIKEKSNMRKDRYSSLSYNLYLARLLERENALSSAQKSLEEMVLEFRAPKIKKKY